MLWTAFWLEMTSHKPITLTARLAVNVTFNRKRARARSWSSGLSVPSAVQL